MSKLPLMKQPKVLAPVCVSGGSCETGVGVGSRLSSFEHDAKKRIAKNVRIVFFHKLLFKMLVNNFCCLIIEERLQSLLFYGNDFV